MKISFAGKRMNAPVTAANGVINSNTIFRFDQSDDLISAHYSGGKVLSGYLIGKMTGDKFEFRYCQMDSESKLNGGHSICDLKLLSDGRLQLTEHFQWADGSTGKNIIEELSDFID